MSDNFDFSCVFVDKLPCTIADVEEIINSKKPKELTKESIREICANPIFDMSKKEKKELAIDLSQILESYELETNELNIDFPGIKEEN